MPTTIPRRDVDFNILQEIILSSVDSNKARWALDLAWLSTVMQPVREQWNEAWSNHTDPAARTTVVVFKKAEARAMLEKQLRVLIKTLKSNTRVSDEERLAMGIVIPSGNRRPLPPPVTIPELDIRTPLPRRLAVRFSDEGSKRRGRPRGAQGAVLRWALRETAPAEIEEMNNTEFETQSPLILDFEESQRGSRIYFCASWQSPTGAKGPWSNIKSAIIP
jgi:hypothetical protein